MNDGLPSKSEHDVEVTQDSSVPDGVILAGPDVFDQFQSQLRKTQLKVIPVECPGVVLSSGTYQEMLAQMLNDELNDSSWFELEDE